MTHIIAVANQKGGTGKTTTTAAIGAALQDAGQNVLLVDLDPQGSLTDALGVRNAPPVLYEAWHALITGGDLPRGLTQVQPSGETLIPATIELAAIVLESVQADRREYVVQDLLALCGAYDTILLDCPPDLSLLTLNALVAADAVLIPVTPEHMAVRGLKLLLTTVRRVQGTKQRPGLNPRLRVLGVLVTMLTNTTHHKEQRALVQETLAALDLPYLGDIPRRTSMQEAAGAGVAPTRYPDTNGARAAYQAVAERLLQEGW